jgi:hypothetical protein
MTIIRRRGVSWLAGAPQPVGDPATLLARLRAMAGGAPVALGLDCPLGLPRAYAAQLQGLADFPDFLRRMPVNSPFWQPASALGEVSAARPFYPARGAAGMTRLSHALALNLADAAALCRACDRATAERPAGAPVFWTLGANQSGKAALSAWRNCLLPGLRADVGLRLWPFEGRLASLLQPGGVAVAETYPAEALRQLGLRPAGSKRRQADRRAHAPALFAAAQGLGVTPSRDAAGMIDDGFGTDAAGEDRFDCWLGALCVVSIVTGQREDFVPPDPWISRWEGWVLGQTALPLKPPATV